MTCFNFRSFRLTATKEIGRGIRVSINFSEQVIMFNEVVNVFEGRINFYLIRNRRKGTV